MISKCRRLRDCLKIAGVLRLGILAAAEAAQPAQPRSCSLMNQVFNNRRDAETQSFDEITRRWGLFRASDFGWAGGRA
jgi:hypothetical protein